MDGIKDEVATEDGNINNDECCHVKIISNYNKPNKKKEKGSAEAEAIIVKVKSPSKLKRKTEHNLGVVSGVEGEVVRDEICDIDEDKTISKKKIKPNEELKKEEDEISDEKVKSSLNEKRSEHLQDNVQGIEQTTPDGAKKGPSRSALRKKAKRQWTREHAKISQKMEGFVLPPYESTRILKDKEVLCVKREEMDMAEAIEGADAGNLLDYSEVNMKEPVNNGMLLLPKEELEDEPSPITASTNSSCSRSEHLQANVEGVEQASTALDGTKKVPSRSARRKKAKRHWLQELVKISQKMEGFVLPPSESTRILKDMEVLCVKSEGVAWNEAIEGADAGNLVDYAEVNWKESVKSEHLQANVEGVEQASTALDGAKKVPSRSARRKKAKKQWKRELAKISQKPDTYLEPQVSKAENKEANGVHPEGLVIDFIDFDKLPLCTSPKEGDVTAYRVVELSSSWTPELSSYRVGKISHFDTNNIILTSVPEYPIVFDKMDEDGPDNYSLYKEDGSLEINFSGLVDVRNVKQSNDTDLIEIKIEREREWN